MPFQAITGVFGFVSSVISTYEVIHDTVRHCRSRFRPDRAEGELLRSLVRGMEDVEQEYENGYSWWGQRFARGDGEFGLEFMTLGRRCETALRDGVARRGHDRWLTL
jgi:hypothetical protein